MSDPADYRIEDWNPGIFKCAVCESTVLTEGSAEDREAEFEAMRPQYQQMAKSGDSVDDTESVCEPCYADILRHFRLQRD